MIDYFESRARCSKCSVRSSVWRARERTSSVTVCVRPGPVCRFGLAPGARAGRSSAVGTGRQARVRPRAGPAPPSPARGAPSRNVFFFWQRRLRPTLMTNIIIIITPTRREERIVEVCVCIKNKKIVCMCACVLRTFC